MQAFADTAYTFFIARRQKIINIFKIIYLLMIFFTVCALLFSRINNTLLLFFGSFGNFFGQISLLTFIVTFIPGIGERLGLKNKFLSILKIYRKYIGISMYLFALLHVVLLKILFITSFTDLFFQNSFEIMGTISLLILFFLFITSNAIGLNRLKINWFRLHRLTYIAMFFIFFHVALQGLSFWTILMGLFILIQIISFTAIYVKTKSLIGGKPI